MLGTLLLNAVVAAALGAGTNELAIIAILRYILPRKKTVLAERLRDMIASRLLTPEKMRAKLDEPRVSELLARNIGEAMDELLGRDLPPPKELFPDQAAALDEVAERLKNSLVRHLRERVATEEFSQDVLRPFLEERWEALRDRSPASLLIRKDVPLAATVTDAVQSLSDSASLRQGFHQALDDWLAGRMARSGTLADLLPPGVSAALEDFVVSQTPFVADQVTLVLREPSVQDTITAAVMDAIDEQLRPQGMLGSIKGAVVTALRVERDVKGVCERLPETLRERFATPEIRATLATGLRSAAGAALRSRLDASARTPAARKAFTAMVMNGVWRAEVFEDLGERIGGAVQAAFERPIGETVRRLGVTPSRPAVLEEAVARCRRILASPATQALVEEQIEDVFRGWKARPLGRLGRFVSDDMRRRLAAAAAQETQALLRERLDSFAEEAGVWDIVVDSVSGYSDREISDLVLQLARRELAWVTILGGVIGATVGVLQTFVQQYAG